MLASAGTITSTKTAATGTSTKTAE